MNKYGLCNWRFCVSILKTFQRRCSKDAVQRHSNVILKSENNYKTKNADIINANLLVFGKFESVHFLVKILYDQIWWLKCTFIYISVYSMRNLSVCSITDKTENICMTHEVQLNANQICRISQNHTEENVSLYSTHIRSPIIIYTVIIS